MDEALDCSEENGAEEKIGRLGIIMLECGRMDEFLKSLSDKKLQEELFVEFGIEGE